MQSRKFLALALVGVLATGCSTSLFEGRKIDYKSASKQLPTLEVPPDLTAPTRDDRFAVPDVNPRSSATYSVYNAERAGKPQATTGQEVLPDVDKMRIERSGSQRWLVVDTPPEVLWPRVKEFWQELGFLINIEQPDAGIMETDWAENRAKIPQDFIRNTIGKFVDQLYSTPERDKFRTRLEPGSKAGTTEIYISHRGVLEIFTSEGRTDTVWQPRPPDPELEAEMLRRLMVRLGVDEVRVKTMLAADQAVERARLQKLPGGAQVLALQEPFDRAWRRVGLALDRVGFTVEDRDRSSGMYFVRYVDPEKDAKSKEEKGFFSRMFSVFSSSKSSNVLTDEARYRVYVKAEGDASAVSVLAREGGNDTSDTSRRIMSLLYEQLK